MSSGWATPKGQVHEVLRYAGVSVVALVVDTSLLYLWAALWQWNETVSTVAAYFAGLAVHYVLSIRFVFGFRRLAAQRRRELMIYLLTGILGAVFSGAVVHVGVSTGMSLLTAKALAILGSFILVFAIRKIALFTNFAADQRGKTA